MQIAASTSTDQPADPIELAFYELRGPQTSAAGRWSQLAIDLWADAQGQGTVTDGRMTYPHDPGTVEDRYWSIPDLVRDGIDPDTASAQARAGAAALFAALERGAAQSDAWRVEPQGSRVPRMPDQVDVWIRRASGARARYLVPISELPAGMRDAVRAADAFARHVRASYVSMS